MKSSKSDDAALFAFLGGIFGLFGIAYAVDQQNKREQDQQRHRAELGAVREAMRQLEGNLKEAVARLGNKDSQVQTLMLKLKVLQQREALLQPLAG